MAGYHLTARSGVEMEDMEPKVKINIPNPEKLRTAGDLIHLENISFKHRNAPKPMIEGVSFTVEQGGRCAFVGAVCYLSSPPQCAA